VTDSAVRSATVPTPETGGMTHRQILESMTGLMLSMFVAMLSSTVVSNALPRILHALHGGESAYTWVVTATLLTTTASTPIWGKLADLVSKKLLMQIAIVIFIVASAFAGLSRSTATLIICRAVQGIGAGGIMAMTQVIMAAMVSPRQRGRYSGYLGATFAVATIAGPLVGGVIVDTSWLGWRWCFYVAIPFAAAALVVLQRRLHLPASSRKVTVDYLGAGLITGGVTALLIWVTLAGQQFPWRSTQTVMLVGVGLATLTAAAIVELRVPEPIIPMSLFRHRTVVLATSAGMFLGVAMYGATIFLAQYFQISRGESPTVSGLRTLPMILGLALSSLFVGRLVTAYGRWKPFLVAGSLTAATGFALLGTIRAHTSFAVLAVYMALVGIGLGATIQNLVLSVQNTVSGQQLGAATATVSFFRSLGGAIGVSVLGAILGSSVTSHVRDGLARLHEPVGALGRGGNTIPSPGSLPPPLAHVVESSYGVAVGHIFAVAAPMMALSCLAILFIREVPLRNQSGTQLVDSVERGGAAGEVAGGVVEHVAEAAAPVARAAVSSG
jgi:EmrB/QacA subfamily drug resistance transporter